MQRSAVRFQPAARPRALGRRAARCTVASVQPRQGSSAKSGTSLLTLPAFPLSTVLMPVSTGMLRVYEPRYLAMFKDMARKAAEEEGEGGAPCFLHILSANAAPPALIDQDSVHGLPRVGTAARVKRSSKQADGSLLIEYEGQRRVRLLGIETEEPYLVAVGEWLDDEPCDDGEADALEMQLYDALRTVADLTERLGLEGGGLPEGVHRYAPPPPEHAQGTALVDLLLARGRAGAANQVSMWQRASGINGGGKRRDPYEMMREALGKEARQELFSFAAAGLLDAGTPTAAALLLSRDTAGRLAFVLQAVEPFVKTLQAQAAVDEALNP